MHKLDFGAMRRPQAHQVVLGVGIAMFVFVIASGVVPAITGWHDHSDVQREVFVNVPTALKVAFYAAVATMLLIVAWLASIRVQNWERGLADNRRTTRKNVEKRAKSYRDGVWMQTLLRDPMAGLMHSLLYFGFVSLFIVTVISETDHQLPDRFKFLHGQTYEAYSAGAEIAGLMFLAGIVWAISRRYVQRPYRIRIKTRPEDALILATFLDHRGERVPRRRRAHRVRRASRASRSGRSSAGPSPSSSTDGRCTT